MDAVRQDVTVRIDALLQAFVAQLEALGISVPDRRYIAPGQAIAYDGEQLVVNLQEIGQGQPGRPYDGTYVPQAINLMATMTLTLLRWVASFSGEDPVAQMVPDSAALDASGRIAVQDASAMVQAATVVYANYQITDPGMGFAIGSLVPVGPDGGLAGCRLPITISLS